MEILRTAAEMRAWSLRHKCGGRSVGFVPTMGALHEGHLSLVRASRAECGVTVVSIFVNPAQFAPNEDFDAYPREFDKDSAKCAELGVDAVYAPRGSEMYPEDYATRVRVEGLSEGLCGASRPHFFGGVATVVAKLFNAVLPDRAYFGQKDAQQCAVIQRMARDLDTGVEVVEMPIVREPDGLAMSSRNQYLDETGRRRGLCLSRSLFAARAALEQGEDDAEKIRAMVRAGMGEVDIDYIELVDAKTLKPVAKVDRPVLLAVAAQVGKARLIDNIKFDPEKDPESHGERKAECC